MSSYKSSFRHLLRSAAIAIVGFVLLFMLLNSAQSSYAMKRQLTNSETKLDIACQRMEQNASDAETDWDTYDRFIMAQVDTIAFLLDNPPEGGEPDLQALAEQWNLAVLYLTDATGKVTASVNGSATDLEKDGFARLLAYQRGEDHHPFVTIGDICYYLSVRQDGSFVVGGRESSEMMAKQDPRYTPAYSLRTIKVGTGGYVAAVNTEDNTIAYARDESLIGQPVSALGMSVTPAAGFSGWVTMDGARWFANCRQATEEYLFIALVSETELMDATTTSVWAALAVFGIIVVLIMLYGLFIRQDAAAGRLDNQLYVDIGKKHCANRSVLVSVRSVVAVGIILIFALTYYTQFLAAISRQRVISETKLNDVEQILAENDARIEELTSDFKSEYARRAQNIAWSLNYNPALVSEQGVTDLAEKAQVAALYVFDKRGRTVATNTVYRDFALSTEETDQSYEFWNILKGYKDIIVQDLQQDDTVEHSLIQYVGVKRLDAEGMVQLGLLPSSLAERLQTTGLSNVLSTIAVENGGMLFAVDKETGAIVYCPDKSLIGSPASDYGLTDSAMVDAYTGWQTLNGESCFVTSLKHGDTFLFVAVPDRAVSDSCLSMTLIATLSSFVVLLIIAMLTVCIRKDERGVELKPAPAPASNAAYYETTTESGRKRKTQTASSRWGGDMLPWSELAAAQKMKRVIYAVLAVVALALFVWISANRGTYDSTSILSYILSERWEKAPNIFSASYVLTVLLEVVVISTLLRLVIQVATRNFGARVETIGRLLESFTKYAAIVVGLFYSLQFFGVDSGAILASLGILTAIIGLGAQSLIADIVAGIFIVFEGDFRVGDIVTIDGWRGVVEEIGIRTTKIQSPGKDVKIFRNSAISGVVNMTRQYSYTSCDISVPSGESLEKLEALLEKEFGRLRERLPDIVGGPYYEGIESMGGDASVVLRVTVQCKESDRLRITRELNREIKLFLDRYKAKNLGSVPPTPEERRIAEAFAAAGMELDQDENGQQEPAEQPSGTFTA